VASVKPEEPPARRAPAGEDLPRAPPPASRSAPQRRKAAPRPWASGHPVDRPRCGTPPGVVCLGLATGLPARPSNVVCVTSLPSVLPCCWRSRPLSPGRGVNTQAVA
jgi:hypothetical protein